MTRVPPVRRELVSEHLQQAFDAAVLQAPGGVIPSFGNYMVMLYTPEACLRIHHWAESLRIDSALPKSMQELAALVVAREHDCQYVWNSHAALAKQAGISAELVDALRDKKPLPPLTPQEAALIRYGQEYFRTRRVGKGTFQEALEQFGVQGLEELTMLMGLCATLVFNVHAFDIDLPEHRTEPLLPL